MTGFNTTALTVQSSDGRNFTLLRPFVFTHPSGESVTVPAGATSDGASTPCEMWMSLPPFGTYWMAAFLHDWLYRCTDWPKDKCDDWLLQAMIALNVPEAERIAIYEGVHLGGQWAFEGDRRKP